MSDIGNSKEARATPPATPTAGEGLAVVVPTFNESGTIATLLRALREVLPQARLLVVDDRSPDGTADVVRGLQAGDGRLDLLVRERREGLGPAYIDGFRRALAANPERVVQMDADLSHRPEDLPALLAAVAAGADLALGSRYIAGGSTAGWPWTRRLISRAGSRYAAVVLGLGVRDATGGFRCWRATLLARVIERPLLLRQFGFQIEMLYRARLLGAAVREVPIHFPDRRLGTSKMRLGIAAEALAGVWRLRRAPRRTLVPTVCLSVVVALALVGCGERPAPAADPKWAPHLSLSGPRAEPVLSAGLYPTLSADSGRKAVVEAYLSAWQARAAAPEPLRLAREPLLALYAEAYGAWVTAQGTAGAEDRLRRLWDLSGVAHTTLIPPADIKRALRWQDRPPLSPAAGSTVVLEAAHGMTRFVPFDHLPDAVRLLLAATPAEAADKTDVSAVVQSAVREVCLTSGLASWSPNCPMDVCGSSEPLTRTLILTPVSQVDLAPKAEWSLAAVTVHEAAHIAWFHRPEVSRDPRLLLPVPNEREAWRHTAQFLRGLLRSVKPDVRSYVQVHAADIRTMLQQARNQVRAANRVLRLAEDDESEQVTLPASVSDTALRALPR